MSDYNDNVFINCPFDKDYKVFLRCIVFTVYHSGFIPRCSLEDNNAIQNRIDKIYKIIEDCRYGIHDISKTELNDNNLPRFNMPFELGLFFGCCKFGNDDHKLKSALVLERIKYKYQEYISDISGVDPSCYDGKTDTLIIKIRNWLTQSSKRDIDGHRIIIKNYNQFELEFPSILSKLELDIDNLIYNDLCKIIEEFLKRKISSSL